MDTVAAKARGGPEEAAVSDRGRAGREGDEEATEEDDDEDAAEDAGPSSYPAADDVADAADNVPGASAPN